MKPAAFLAISAFTAAVTSITCGFRFTTGLIVPVTFALTIIQASPCLAYVVTPSASSPGGWADIEQRHRDRHAEDDKKKHKGKHHGKDKKKDFAKHDHKDRIDENASQTNDGGNGNNGNASMCSSAANINETGGTNTTMMGNGTGTLPPGFPPAVPEPGFVAGQKRKRHVSRPAQRTPRSPGRAVYETLYD